MFTRINANAVSYVRMRVFAYVSSRGFKYFYLFKKFKTQTAHKIFEHLNTETIKMYYMVDTLMEMQALEWLGENLKGKYVYTRSYV